MYIVKAVNENTERTFKVNEEARENALEYAKDTLIIDFDEDPKEYKWTARKQSKRQSKLNPVMQSKIEECKKHGFKVTQEGKWLWISGVDERYNKQVIAANGDKLTNKDQETEVLKSLGFQYSSYRMNWYWIS